MARVEGTEVTCHIDVGVGSQELATSRLLQNWLIRARRSGLVIASVDASKVLKWGKPLEIKIAQCMVEGYDGNGRPFKNACLLRGDTVNVLTVVSHGKQEYVVFVAQARGPGAQIVLDCPSGMIDADEGFGAASVREGDEELGEKHGITWDELVFLGEKVTKRSLPQLVSPGGSDERVYFVLRRGHAAKETLQALHNTYGGLASEGEQTKVIVVPLDEALAALSMGGSADLKAEHALLLYYAHIRRLPVF